MPYLSAIDTLNEQLQAAILTQDVQAVIAVLTPENAQAWVHQATERNMFHAMELQLTVHQLQAATRVGPWSLTRLPELLGAPSETLARLANTPIDPQGSELLTEVIGNYDSKTPASRRAAIAHVLLPLVLPHQNVNAFDTQGDHPLAHAIKVHHQGAFEELWPLTNVEQHDAQVAYDKYDAQKKTRSGMSLLLQAAASGSLDMINTLLPRSQPLSINASGQNPLHCAILREERLGEHEDIVKALLPVCNRWQADENNNGPLDHAVHYRRQALVMLMLDGLADHPGPYTQQHPIPWERLHRAYNAAVSGQQWDLAQDMLCVLPQQLASTWWTMSQIHYPRDVESTVKLVVEQAWESRTLRATINAVQEQNVHDRDRPPANASSARRPRL